MQLQFTTDELQLTVDLLELRDEKLRDEMMSAELRDLKMGLHNEEQFLTELESKLMRGDFEFTADELDCLSAELCICEDMLNAQASHSAVRQAQSSIREKKWLLQQVRDKVAEAATTRPPSPLYDLFC